MNTAETHEMPAEDTPTGQFGGARPALPAHITPCSADEQAAHLADLSDALSGFVVGAAIRRHAKTPPRPGPRGEAA
ncbi:hypothetical protein [Streptomyces stelliscabiei]|uniref:Uncharacterized protein n=1 Tax=Streptomyces stelliscabiei TaxID=146820 RepID=A0A8I0P3U4_9ACTN|nr:hypothetical protein [Streptomyces stelliscabiei]KND29886.1 hypothetical protein IQ64_41795 [Streptomyces stelliscabiei]MBE1598993.1 hypothetical protein [Streptomyces stelliscabiei]MBE1599736.1 hypothetical protein [Streptomyces stelliscabiei]MDX2519394.1 hypothetical protein [Streptomyces stelliscabiei]MDX2549677.1 hypothetical protein [Streptomyces stelliscabiei]